MSMQVSTYSRDRKKEKEAGDIKWKGTTSDQVHEYVGKAANWGVKFSASHRQVTALLLENMPQREREDATTQLESLQLGAANQEVYMLGGTYHPCLGTLKSNRFYMRRAAEDRYPDGWVKESRSGDMVVTGDTDDADETVIVTGTSENLARQRARRLANQSYSRELGQEDDLGDVSFGFDHEAGPFENDSKFPEHEEGLQLYPPPDEQRYAATVMAIFTACNLHDQVEQIREEISGVKRGNKSIKQCAQTMSTAMKKEPLSTWLDEVQYEHSWAAKARVGMGKGGETEAMALATTKRLMNTSERQHMFEQDARARQEQQSGMQVNTWQKFFEYIKARDSILVRAAGNNTEVDLNHVSRHMAPGRLGSEQQAHTQQPERERTAPETLARASTETSREVSSSIHSSRRDPGQHQADEKVEQAREERRQRREENREIEQERQKVRERSREQEVKREHERELTAQRQRLTREHTLEKAAHRRGFEATINALQQAKTPPQVGLGGAGAKRNRGPVTQQLFGAPRSAGQQQDDVSKRLRYSSSSGTPRKPTCAAWYKGQTCAYGTRCRFAHSGELTICNEFDRQGSCARGSNCKYRHVSRPGEPTARRSNTGDRSNRNEARPNSQRISDSRGSDRSRQDSSRDRRSRRD